MSQKLKTICNRVIYCTIAIVFTEQHSIRELVRMGILEVLTAPRSRWQNAHAERFIGSLRREFLDHMIILNESSLKGILKTYLQYYEHSRKRHAGLTSCSASRVG